MVKVLSKATEQVGRVAVRAVDFVVENRVVDAESLVRRAREAAPNAAPSVHAQMVVNRVARELATVGAITGAVAVAPGVGTGTALATGAADAGVAFGRIATLVMAVGLAYGIDLSNLQYRRNFVYGILSGSEAELTDAERKAGALKKQLGKQVAGKKGAVPAVTQINDIVGATVATKVLTRIAQRELAVKLLTLLPLGIGAGVGAIGSRALVTGVGRTAVRRAQNVLDEQATGAVALGPAPAGRGPLAARVKQAATKLRPR